MNGKDDEKVYKIPKFPDIDVYSRKLLDMNEEYIYLGLKRSGKRLINIEYLEGLKKIAYILGLKTKKLITYDNLNIKKMTEIDEIIDMIEKVSLSGNKTSSNQSNTNFSDYISDQFNRSSYRYVFDYEMDQTNQAVGRIDRSIGMDDANNRASIIMKQTNVSRQEAFASLQRNGGNTEKAIEEILKNPKKRYYGDNYENTIKKGNQMDRALNQMNDQRRLIEEIDQIYIPETDITLVMSQTNATREQTRASLKRHKGDIVNAIMELT